jgi:hypothetical protein
VFKLDDNALAICIADVCGKWHARRDDHVEPASGRPIKGDAGYESS